MDENRLLMSEIEMIKDGFDRVAKRSDLEEAAKAFDNFVRIEEFRNLEEDVELKAGREDLNTANQRLDQIDRKQILYLKQEDFYQRMNLLQS